MKLLMIFSKKPRLIPIINEIIRLQIYLLPTQGIPDFRRAISFEIFVIVFF